jgi:putative membrane protein
MRHVLALAALVLMVAFIPARAADDSKLSSKDTKFVNNAASGGEMEVALGKLAATKATNDDVKKFGQQMVDDHSKANEELKGLAKGKGVDLTKAEEKATKMESKEEGKLAKKEGDAFDKAYMDMMVKDHEDDVKEFEKASKDCDDADLKAWAAKTLPTLKSHLEMAKDVKGKLK